MSNRTRKFPKPKTPPEALRLDSWENQFNGLGVQGVDKRLGSNITRLVIDQLSAEEIWRSDDIAARIVETFPKEMLRKPWSVQSDGDQETQKAFKKWDRVKGLRSKLRKALQYKRAYGGAGILLNVDDGSSSLERPLNEARIRSLDHLTVFTPRELYGYRYYTDPMHPKYGEVSHYLLQPISTPMGNNGVQPIIVHESRIVRFDGVNTSREQGLRNSVAPGWNDSIFVRCLQVVSDFQHSWQAAGILTQDFAPPVLKMKGLFTLLQSKAAEAQGGVANRLRALEVSSSTARVKLLDSEEEYKRESTNVQGLPDLLEKFMARLAAAVEMPVSLLMGNSPSGLNSTGDSEMRWYYDRVACMLADDLEPQLHRIYEVAMLAADGPTEGEPLEDWEIAFESPWQLGEDQQADVRLKQAQADNLDVTNGTLLPEEVARNRFGGPKYSTDTKVDPAERQKLMETEAERQAAATVAGRAADPQGPEAQAAKAAAQPKPAMKNDSGFVLDFDPDQPRDKDGEWSGGAKSEAEHAASAKAATNAQLSVRIARIFHASGKVGAEQQKEHDKEYNAIAKELKSRGIKSFGALEKAVSAGRER